MTPKETQRRADCFDELVTQMKGMNALIESKYGWNPEMNARIENWRAALAKAEGKP